MTENDNWRLVKFEIIIVNYNELYVPRTRTMTSRIRPVTLIVQNLSNRPMAVVIGGWIWGWTEVGSEFSVMKEKLATLKQQQQLYNNVTHTHTHWEHNNNTFGNVCVCVYSTSFGRKVTHTQVLEFRRTPATLPQNFVSKKKGKTSNTKKKNYLPQGGKGIWIISEKPSCE
jgi:hypothetical protein